MVSNLLGAEKIKYYEGKIDKAETTFLLSDESEVTLHIDELISFDSNNTSEFTINLETLEIKICKGRKKMKKSKILITSMVLGVLYSLYLISHFGSGVLNSTSGAETLGASMATIIVLPHMIIASLGSVFSVIAVVTYKQWASMTAFILYFVASALFPVYAMFTIPIGILATIGWIKMKKQSQVISQ